MPADKKTNTQKNFYFFVAAALVLLIALFAWKQFGVKDIEQLEKNAVEQGSVVPGGDDQEPGQYLQAEVKPSEKGLADFKEQTKNLPINPSSATAICRETGEIIPSGQTTDCNDPVFTWPEVKGAIGYFVYWYKENDTEPQRVVSGDKIVEIHPQRPIVVTANKFEPNQGYLIKGNTYKLMVQTVTAATDQTYAGGEVVDADKGIIKDAKKLFVFNYQ